MQTISPATEKDIPQLCDLLAILFTLEAEFSPDAARQASALRQIIEHHEAGRLLVLRKDEQVIGMVNLLFTVSTALGGKVALLEDMVLHPEYQNDGLGSKLLQDAVELAKKEGCLRIKLLTDRANDAAIRFYRRHGFTMSEMLTMRQLC